MAISPDGDSVVQLLETEDTDVTVVNRQRDEVGWIDLEFSDEAPVTISDTSARSDAEQDPEDYRLYLSLGSILDEDGEIIHPVEICLPPFLAVGLAQAILMSLGEA